MVKVRKVFISLAHLNMPVFLGAHLCGIKKEHSAQSPFHVSPANAEGEREAVISPAFCMDLQAKGTLGGFLKASGLQV